MKLLFITQNEAPFRMKWMDELANYMDVTVFHLGEYEKNINMKYISYHTSKAITENIHFKVFGKKFFKIRNILKEDYDILLLDGYGFIAQQLLILFLIVFKKKYGLSIDGGFINQKENKVKMYLKKFFIKNSSFYFSTSKDTDDFLIYYGATQNKIYRHFFSNIEKKDIIKKTVSKEEKTIIRKKIKIEDKLTLISVGKLIPIKGYDILAEAISNIDIDFQLFIIGANEDNELTTEIQKNNKVKVIKFLEKKDLNNYYLASDLFVLPTRGDVWGLVIGEAMAKGLPIITTDKCLAGKAMIENKVNGYIVPSENSKYLREAIEQLSSENLDIYSQNNLIKINNWCIECSSLNDIKNLEKIYKRLNV